jgi:hypothetical protein
VIENKKEAIEMPRQLTNKVKTNALDGRSTQNIAWLARMNQSILAKA